ncbi:MAG: ABC transporter ATP-binding protein [Candidatus Omnitrophota bacterium]
MILEIKSLSITYRGKEEYVEALKGVSFGLNEGEILGVIGESGSGKSTLALSVLNLLPFDSKKQGRIIFEDKNIFSLKDKELEFLRGNRIGLIFQEPASVFNPVLSIGYQFKEVLENRLGIKNKQEQQKIILNSLNKVRLGDTGRILKSYPHQLSGGQLQRIAIAIAIAQKPAILIADEPTSSLDVTIESQIIYLFKELQKELNLTVIFITHNLDLIKVLADRTVVLYKGEVKEIRDKDELFASPQNDYTKSLIASFKELEA